MDLIRILAWVYFLLLMGVVALDFIPQFADPEGRLFSLFTLDLNDNALHAASGIWAGVAAWHSRSWSVTFLRLFGIIYFFDGVLGFFTGSGYLDFGIFIYGVQEGTWTFRFLTNIPHLALGGFAIFAGYVLSRRPATVAA